MARSHGRQDQPMKFSAVAPHDGHPYQSAGSLALSWPSRYPADLEGDRPRKPTSTPASTSRYRPTPAAKGSPRVTPHRRRIPRCKTSPVRHGTGVEARRGETARAREPADGTSSTKDRGNRLIPRSHTSAIRRRSPTPAAPADRDRRRSQRQTSPELHRLPVLD